MKVICTFSDKRFDCVHCGHCCTTSSVVVHENEDIGTRIRDQVKEGMIKDSDHKVCVFYKDKCEVYDKRPQICKEFPFKIIYVSDKLCYVDRILSCATLFSDSRTELDFRSVAESGYEIYKSDILENKKFGAFIDVMIAKEYDFDILIDPLELFMKLSGEKGEWNYFIKKFCSLYSGYLESEFPYSGYDPIKGFYEIRLVNELLMISGADTGIIIDPGVLKRKELDAGAKSMLSSYFGNLWSRAATITDVFYAQKLTSLAVDTIIVESMKRILLLFQFIVTIIAHKNGNTLILEQDIKEAIFVLDASILTPMQDMIPALKAGKKKFF